jgi:hypothetical protein
MLQKTLKKLEPDFKVVLNKIEGESSKGGKFVDSYLN